MIPTSPHADLADDERDAFEYLASVATGLANEASQRSGECRGLSTVTRQANELADTCHITQAVSVGTWAEFCARYRHLVHLKANALNELSNVSHPYVTIEDFWDDVAAQGAGKSPRTFWDVYEHGRRRQLEALLAHAYGAESALLVNSGMSAIVVSLGMLSVRPGLKLLTGNRGYFETTEYLERFLRPMGIQVIRTSVSTPGEIVRVLSDLRPDIALFETVTNAPTAEIPCDWEQWFAASPTTFFVIDNSLQSHLTRWFDLVAKHVDRLIVVESAVKYLTHECMAGVVYGDATNVDRVREFARLTGQQLQEKAFNYICEGEVAHIHWRLERHSRNVQAVVRALEPYDSSFEFVYSPSTQANASPSALRLIDAGPGGVVFIALRLAGCNDDENKTRLHRELLQRWQDRVHKSGLKLFVRAGFGWDETTARVYDSTKLNQADAPTYLRIAVGIEPRWIVESLARELGEAARELTTQTCKSENLGMVGAGC